MLPKKSMKKRAPRRRVVRRRRAPVRKYLRGGHVKEYASAQYTTTALALKPAQAMSNGIYQFYNFSLAAAADRIQLIAQNYQEYRIKRITWDAKGYFDTFQAAVTATTPTVPHLYWRVDKSGTYSASSTLNTLKSSGCKPIRLDDKLIRKSFKPSVMQAVASAPGAESATPDLVLGSHRVSPWLPTNQNAYVAGSTTWDPSSIDHLGLLIGIDSDVVPFGGPCASIQFTVEFEFRKPLDDTTATGAVVSEVVDLADLQPKANPPEELKMV